jgi:tetratricopeptide (TPR) repeat protein
MFTKIANANTGDNEIPNSQGDSSKMTTNTASQPSVNYIDSGDLVPSLQKVVELYPDYAQAHHDLGGAYYQNGDHDSALVHYEKAVEIDPDNVTYLKSVADFHYSISNRVEDALALYSKVLDQQPRNLEALLMAGHISVMLQRFDDAEEYYKRVLEIEPGHQDAGLLLEKLQNRQKSDDGPASAEEQYAQIQTLINDGRPNEAVSALETLLEYNPDFALAHNDLGVLCYQQGDKDKALDAYETAARLEPSNSTFQKNLADYYYVEEGRVEEAMQVYVKVLENDPEDCETLLILGHICVALHKFEDAESFYNRLLAIEPWNAEARENIDKLAKRHTAITTGTSAEEEYEKIQGQLQNGDGEAVNRLEKLLAAHPQFAPAHNDLGVLYYNRGDKEKALSHYEQAVRLEPQDTIFQKNLADFYFVESGRVEDALAVYNQVLEVNAGDVEALMSIALICEAVEKPEDAIHFYNRVLENEPWNMDARERLDNLYPN